MIDACTDIAYDVTAPAAGGVVSSRSVFPADSYPEIVVRVTTCLENQEMSGILLKVREMSGKKSC